MLEKAVDIAFFNDEEIIIRPQQPIESIYMWSSKGW